MPLGSVTHRRMAEYVAHDRRRPVAASVVLRVYGLERRRSIPQKALRLIAADPDSTSVGPRGGDRYRGAPLNWCGGDQLSRWQRATTAGTSTQPA